jgi:hypothetical protein
MDTNFNVYSQLISALNVQIEQIKQYLRLLQKCHNPSIKNIISSNILSIVIYYC